MTKTALAQLIRPAAPVRLGTSAPLPILSMTMRNGLVDQADKFKKRIASTDLSPYKIVGRGQLVVGFPIDEAVLAIQTQYEKAVVSPAYAIWDVQESRVDARYLELFLRGPQAVSYYKARLQGSTARRRSLPNSVFLEMEVPLPPLPEQRRIAAILDQANEIRRQRLRAISLIAQIEVAAFEDMMLPKSEVDDADPSRFGTYVTSYQNGAYFPAGAYGQGVPILRIADFDRGDRLTLSGLRRVGAGESKTLQFRLEPGDLVINRVNAMSHIGKAALVVDVTEPTIFESNMMRIRLDKSRVSPTFALAWLSSASTVAQLRGAAKQAVNQVSVNQTDIANLKIRVPSLARQQRFIDLLAEIEVVRRRAWESERDLGELFASLQYRAFEGTL